MWHQICEACEAGIPAGAGACSTFFYCTLARTERRQATIAAGGCAGGGHHTATGDDYDGDCVAQQHQFPSQLTSLTWSGRLCALPNQNHRHVKTDQRNSQDGAI
jgi:hypothetical protein